MLKVKPSCVLTSKSLPAPKRTWTTRKKPQSIKSWNSSPNTSTACSVRRYVSIVFSRLNLVNGVELPEKGLYSISKTLYKTAEMRYYD